MAGPRPLASRRPSSLRTAGVAVLACLLAGALAGCGDTPVILGKDVPAGQRAACAALLDALPDEVSGLARKEVDGRQYAAAWGDPAIVLRCGAGKPAGFDKFSACQRAEGIDWFVPESIIEDQSADVVMTTVGRDPDVEVEVPAQYRPTLGPMVDLAPALEAHTRADGGCQ